MFMLACMYKHQFLIVQLGPYVSQLYTFEQTDDLATATTGTTITTEDLFVNWKINHMEKKIELFCSADLDQETSYTQFMPMHLTCFSQDSRIV